MSGKPRLKTPAQITAPSQLPMPETLMADLLTLENLFNLGVLIFLQAVLGFDNLLYISIESQRAPKEMQAKVRRDGILIAIGLRIVLLFAMMQLIAALQEPFVVLNLPGIIEGGVNFSTVVFILGGGFINSILSALAITDVFVVLAVAVLVSGLGMLLLADRVSDFIQRNRKFEVMGLFILLIVGVVLLGEAGHAAQPHLHLFGFAVEPMSKATFYFSIAVLVVVDLIQAKYQRKLDALRAREQGVVQRAE
jgi:predicted tellurium resistance membrane protein TerC